MKTVIKIDLEKILNQNNPIIIDVGCGQKKKFGRIGIDRVDLPEIDIVTDIEQGLPFFPNHSVDEIHCRSVLEHIKNFEFLLREMMRVLKKEGKVFIAVPHFSSPHYYSDPTHVRLFGLYTFYYFVNPEHQLRRKVPTYYSDIRIKIFSQNLIFRSKFGLFSFLKKAIGWVINKSKYLQEYYEENLVYLIPAQKIEIVIGHPDNNL